MIPVRMSKNKKQIPFSAIGKSWSDQRGTTGLETAIVLIALVVVS
jgi:Flp pilus assembly protein TadG